MDFLHKLELLMKKHNIENLYQLSEKTKIPYTTIRSFYEKGTENIKLSTLIKLKDYFQCTLDYLVVDEITNPYQFTEVLDNEFDENIKQLEANGTKIIIGKNSELTNESYIKLVSLLTDEMKKNNKL